MIEKLFYLLTDLPKNFREAEVYKAIL